MRILVTGTTGFIGAAFSRLALDRGHEVGGLILPGERAPGVLVDREGLTWLTGSLAEPPWRAIEAFQADVCVHFAWIATPGAYLESPQNELFLLWSKDFLWRARQCGVGHILGVGTCIEYRSAGHPLAEDRDPAGPTSLYARCKNELRLQLEEAARVESFGLGWGRVFYPYGPGEHPSRLASSILQKLGRGEAVVLQTPQSRKDYIFIEDLAAAILITLERRHVGLINWGTGTGVTVGEMAGILGRLVGRPDLVQLADPPRPDPLPYVVADSTRLRALGWTPRVGLEEGLRRLLAQARREDTPRG